VTAPHAVPQVVRRHDDERVARVVDILVEAFYADPLWSWAFPDPLRRRAQHRWLWGLSVQGALRYPWVRLDAVEAACAVWIPPGGTELTDEAMATFERRLAELAGDSSDRVHEALELLEHAHPEGEPHYYLSLLGTDPRQLGHGYGLGLLGASVALIDEERMPAYLEASNPANVPLYERYGFAVHSSFTLSDGGPEVFTMWRDAR
jgi:hypothetical protein